MSEPRAFFSVANFSNAPAKPRIYAFSPQRGAGRVDSRDPSVPLYRIERAGGCAETENSRAR